MGTPIASQQSPVPRFRTYGKARGCKLCAFQQLLDESRASNTMAGPCRPVVFHADLSHNSCMDTFCIFRAYTCIFAPISA